MGVQGSADPYLKSGLPPGRSNNVTVSYQIKVEFIDYQITPLSPSSHIDAP